MTVSTQLALAGLSAGILSSLLLAISLGRFNQAVWSALEAHGLTLETLTDPSTSVVLFTGLEKHLQRGARRASWLTGAGLVLLTLSFLLQGAALLLSVQPSLLEGVAGARSAAVVTPVR